ncbi:MAG TPA: efflux RND transporter permease subunit [Kiritimatiellia bacterium]|nr:efflux RND transporter permease subunit [Kiritimatiellia bacterium]HMP34273.1 efflux RND transporter permease subunit [Kiritimatiellia bacterium]
MNTAKTSWMSGLIDAFLRGNLTILLIIVSLAAGAAALLLTPREEEPQIVVPVADVLISAPGLSAGEMERLVSSRLERMLFEIDGVEYVYSMSRPGQAVVTVRFFVGQSREESLIKLYNKIFQNIDKTTPGITGWVVKPVEIDDVPVITAALHSEHLDTHALYRVAEEIVTYLQDIPNAAAVTIHGGERRIVHVRLDRDRLAAHGLSPMDVMAGLNAANVQLPAGQLERDNRVVRVEAGPFLADAREVGEVMVGVYADRPVYVRDVAEVMDGPAELATITRLGFGPGSGRDMESRPAITIAVAKKKGSNAVRVTGDVRQRLEALRGNVLPDEVEVLITRDYGQTADAKVNDLMKGLFEAIITVIVLITLVMNWRVGLIVALAVPITYALTLFVNMLAGYTINRVTLFALILALGLLVDDPIVAVENIYRHLTGSRKRTLDAISDAMNEVMPPIVLATLSVIVAFLPMFFITGMMGPYMRPMALNVPLAMISSLLVSFTITPWISSRMLARLPHEDLAAAEHADDERPGRVHAWYGRIMRPFLDSRRVSILLMLVVGILFAGSVLLALLGVPLKMLPFDNKNEFQLVVDLPEASALAATDAVLRDLEDFLRTQPEVTDFTSYAGLASPMDFNGMVRHYYLRQGPHLGEIRVNLLPRERRAMDSHSMVLRIRNDIEAIAARHGALIRLVETPPGPPVLASVVAEVYGEPHHRYDELVQAAHAVAARMELEDAVVEADVITESAQPKLFFRVDRDKAALNGVSVHDVTHTLGLALGGAMAGAVHQEREQNELPILVQLPRELRSDIEYLKTLGVKNRSGNLVQLGELGVFEPGIVDATIFHKNLKRVVYVTAEMAGRGPAYAVFSLDRHFEEHPLPSGITLDWSGEGEWKITIDVFRDLGLAFAAALLAIYVLLVYETRSYALPGIIMLSIPLTMIGIMPGFWLLNLVVNRPVGGFENPVFFTATAMIGMIALAGIVVRNGIILIDFIRTNLQAGRPLREAVINAGAVRLRPIVLTAGTTMLGAWPITLDPIFSGLAWSIMFGLFVSTAFTLVVVPVAYVMLYGEKERAG